MTRQHAETLVHHYLDLAHRAEAKRDTFAYQSREYWHYHDQALGWHGLADGLLPKGDRPTEDTSARKPLTRRCAWCDSHLGGPKPELNHPETHGICLSCSDRMLEEVR